MRIFKWSPAFSISSESPIAPVWVSLPGLPAHYFAKGSLFSIVCLIGESLKVDSSMVALVRPNMARVCVEVNLQ